MWSKLVDFLKAPIFLNDEETKLRARALNALHLNISAVLLILGTVGILFVFVERLATTFILLSSVLIILGGILLNHRITERKQIEVRLRQRADEMALLYKITLALTSEEDLYHALRVLVQELKHVMTVDAFHIGLYDEQTDLLSYSLFLNLEEDLQVPPRKLREEPGL